MPFSNKPFLAQPVLETALIDCVICGYNDTDYEQYSNALKLTQRFSGAYHTVLSNSVLDGITRLPYMDLLNQTLWDVTNTNPKLHICNLPNLGVSYLKNYLLKWNMSVEIINFFSEQKEELIRLLASNPLSLAITTTFYTTLTPIIEIVEFVRAANSTVKIIVGGPFIFNLCAKNDVSKVDATLSRIGADIYVHDSQGERTLVDVINALKNGGSLDDVANILHRTKGKTFKSAQTRLLLTNNAIRRTRRIEENNEMDKYSVDWRNFPDKHFVPTVQMRTARSCAYKCAFCCYPIMAGELSLTNLDVIEKEMIYLKSRGVENIVFIDDTFNIPQNRFKDLCKMMIRNKFNFNWFSYFRASNADKESIHLTAESGCKGVFLGIESGDQDILNKMNKAVKVEKYISGIQELNRLGVFTFVSLIVGYPGETSRSVTNSIQFLRDAKPSGFRAELYFHSTNTPVHDQAEQYQLVGEGYSWRHASLRWQDAVNELVQMYSSVTDCPVVAEHMFDFWSLPYLIGKGMTKNDYEAFIKAAHPFLVRSMKDEPFDPLPYKVKLREALADVRLR